jgi:hypothetical protein
MRNVLIVWAGAALLCGALLTSCSSSSSGGSSSTGGQDVTTGSDATAGTDTTVSPGDDVTNTDTDGTGGTGDTDVICVPFCQDGWQCGSNGCGGTCGTCEAGESCNTAQRTCEKAAEPLKAYGESCGLTDTCNSDAANWPACLDAQCDSGQCQLGGTGLVCTKSCSIAKDTVDATGANNPDGIEDPDAQASDCEGASPTSPYGTKWACVTVGDPAQGNANRLCQPGTTFATCTSDKECPADESCQIYVVNGQYGTRCATKRIGSNPSGSLCNDDPAAGELAYCASELCFGIGCVGLCAVDSDCASFQVCQQDRTIFSNAPDLTFDLCFGKPCDSNTNCSDISHCELFGNGEQGDAFKLDNLCVADAAGASKLGGACDGDTTDDVPGPECSGLCLQSGTCSGLCKGDSDCSSASKPMFCNATEESADFDGDKTDDTLIVYGLCVPYEGSKSECHVSADCTVAGEACDFYQVFLPDGSLEGIGYCTKAATEGAAIGELCGGDTKITCKSGFCLNINATAGVCMPLCASTADCPQGFLKDAENNPSGINSYCRGYFWSDGGTLNATNDNVFIPLCSPTSGDDSLDDCAATKTCTEATETCIANAVAFGASGPASIENHCVESGDSSAKFGASCNPNPTDTTAATALCEDIYCLEDSKANAGYCSRLCNTDADCQGSTPDFVCDESTYLERKTGESLTLKLCRKAKSCLPCSDDSQCTDGYVCGNIGTTGLNADFRCVPGCAADADCTGTDGGDKCVDTKDATGKATGKLACVVSSCN